VNRLELDKIIRRFSRVRGDLDEWPLSSTPYPLTIWPSHLPTRDVLFVTKPSGLLGINLRLLLPRYVTCFLRFGFTSERQWQRLRTEHQLGAYSLTFVGDLDPVDLTVHASLVCGASRHRLRVVYHGIDEQWLQLCRRRVTSPSATLPWGLPVVLLSSFETAVYESLRRLPGALPEALGESARALLDAGYKLELEGASNPVCYQSGFAAALSRMLQRRFRHAVGSRRHSQGASRR
jgi:hypothetical protein